MRINDSNYLKMLKQKNEKALEFVVNKYLPLVKGITYKSLSSLANKELNEECINDIFFSVWNNANKFKGEECDFKKWICAISKFKAIDYYRKSTKNKELLVDNIIEEEQISAEDEFIISEEREELMKLIDTLDEFDKKIFVMKFFLIIKNEDIAKKLGVTKASIDNRIYRSKKRLKCLRNKSGVEVI